MKTKKYLELIPIACMILTLFFVNRGEGADPKTAKLAIIPEIKSNKSSFFYIDFENFPRERKTLPVGIFDSGTGGLTVLDSILELDQFNNKTHEKGALFPKMDKGGCFDEDKRQNAGNLSNDF